MKKKLLMLLATAGALSIFSGQAMAFFSTGDLIQVVYQSGGANEVATDLGAFNPTTAYSGADINFTNPFPIAGAVGTFSGAGWANLQVAYFIQDPSGVAAWVSGPQSGQTNGSRQGTGFQSNATSVLSKYGSLGGSQVVLAQSDLQSYYTKMDKGGVNGAIGSFGGFIPAANGEQNLAALGTTGFVDSYLYYYGAANSSTPGLQVADIRTLANGTSKVVGTSAVPIPAPVMLLGSGLLGLIGIRRKQAV